MATEIEGLKARVAELERENEQLQRDANSTWNFEHTCPLTSSGVSSTTILHRQHHQPIAREQQMVTLQVEIAQLRQQNVTLRESNQALRKQLENQEEMFQLRDVS
jgi:cell division protein FtsB